MQNEANLLITARNYGAKARAYNRYGASNLSFYPRGLSAITTVNAKLSNKIPPTLTPQELEILPAIVAQRFFQKECNIEANFFDEAFADLSLDEKQLIRLKQALTIALYGAKRGSMNCDIANLALALMLHDELTIPISIINISGYWDDKRRDYTHTILVLGPTQQFQDAISSLHKSNFSDSSLNNLIICDPHHNEYYPLRDAFKVAGEKLGRYHDVSMLGEIGVDNDKMFRIRRLFFLDNLQKFSPTNPELKPFLLDILNANTDTLVQANVTTEIEAQRKRYT